MRLTAVAALVLLGSLVACESGSGGCPAPTDRESRYPFTGIFVGDSTSAHVCLYQQDVRTVRGRLEGSRAVGYVSQDGTLTLAVGADAGADLYTLSLAGDTLQVTRALSASGTGVQMPDQRLVRSAPE